MQAINNRCQKDFVYVFICGTFGLFISVLHFNVFFIYSFIYSYVVVAIFRLHAVAFCFFVSFAFNSLKRNGRCEQGLTIFPIDKHPQNSYKEYTKRNMASGWNVHRCTESELHSVYMYIKRDRRRATTKNIHHSGKE